MTSPPGTYQMSAGDPVTGGVISVEIRFNITTGAIENRGSPPAALVCDNQTSRVCPVTYTGPAGVQTLSVPVGVTRVTANQLSAQGFDTKSDVQGMSLAVPAA
jgi:hypothetical protein